MVFFNYYLCPQEELFAYNETHKMISKDAQVEDEGMDG